MRLRNETRVLHEGLDGAFESLGENGADEGYARFLRMNEACLTALEPVLAESGVFERLLGQPVAPRAPAARADLEALGLRPIVSLPFDGKQLDFSEAIGIAYVLEGSRLGARQILKRFADLGWLDNGRAIPTCFLRSAGEAEHFRSFMNAAEGAVSTERDRDRAVEAANRTFEYFIGTLRLADRAPGGSE